MMFHKALLFNDTYMADKILKEKNPKKQKRLGREISGFNQDIWDRNKSNIIYYGNLFKFTQSPHLLKTIRLTRSMVLVEASKWDKMYGIGLSLDEITIDESQWKGYNLLGVILTFVRDDILGESIKYRTIL